MPRSDPTSVMFFAGQDDLRPLISVFESRQLLQFVQCGLFEEQQRPILSSLSGVGSLGIAENGDANLEPAYLVIRRGTDVQVRPVSQRRGGTKFAVDQLMNPGTVVFRPGGKVPASNVVIGGSVGTVRDDAGAAELMKQFFDEIRTRFVRIKGFWVGPSALTILRLGGRLTNAVSTPLEYDLKE